MITQVAPQVGASVAPPFQLAKFGIGQVVRHRIFALRGIVFDVDAVFANTEDWWLALPAEARPRRDQPFYHLLAEDDDDGYVAYVAEQNLAPDHSGEPVGNSNARLLFDDFRDGRYHLRASITH